MRGLAQFGSAHGLGPWGRGFESLNPDHVGAKFALLRFSLPRKTSARFLAPPLSQKAEAFGNFCGEKFACFYIVDSEIQAKLK